MTDQPMPKPGRHLVTPVAFERFRSTLIDQSDKGFAKYGTRLETHNGRDAGQDAWEELVDLAQYLTQLRLEHDDLIAENTALRAQVARLEHRTASANPLDRSEGAGL